MRPALLTHNPACRSMPVHARSVPTLCKGARLATEAG